MVSQKIVLNPLISLSRMISLFLLSLCTAISIFATASTSASVALSTWESALIEGQDWNIAIGLNGTNWEIYTNQTELSAKLVGLEMIESLRPGYGYWVRKQGQKRFSPLKQSDHQPLILEITHRGYAFVNPGLQQDTAPDKLFDASEGIQSVWQYDAEQHQWAYYSPQGVVVSDATPLLMVRAGAPLWVKTSRDFARIIPEGATLTVVVEGGAEQSTQTHMNSSIVFKLDKEISRRFMRGFTSKKRMFHSRKEDLPRGLDLELIGDLNSSDSYKQLRVILIQPDQTSQVLQSPRLAGRNLRLPLHLSLNSAGLYKIEVQLKTESGWTTRNSLEWNIESAPAGLLGLFEQLRRRAIKSSSVITTRSGISLSTSQLGSTRQSYLSTDEVQVIHVHITGPDIDPLLQVFNGFHASGTLKIPPGSDRKIVVEFKDKYGDVMVSGAITMDVTPSATESPKISLEPQPLKLPDIILNAPEPGIYVAPVELGVQASGAEIYYTLDGSDPKMDSNQSVFSAKDTISLSFQTNTVFRYFVKGDNAIRSGTETLKYTVVPPPQAELKVLDANFNGNYLEQVRTRLISQQADTIVYYTTDGSEPTENSTVGVTPVDLVFNSGTTLRYFAESKEGFKGALQSTQFNIIQLEDLSGIGLNVPKSGLYLAPLKIGIAIKDAEILYSLDGTNPLADGNLNVAQDTLQLALESSATFRYSVRFANGVVSRVRTHDYEVAPPPDITLKVIDPSLNGNFLERAKVRFESIYGGTSVFYTLDGSQPNLQSQSSTVPLTLIFDANTTLSYFAESKEGFYSQTESAQFTIIPDPIVRETQPSTAVAALNGLHLDGIQFPGQKIKLLVNSELKTDSVSANKDQTGFQIAIDNLQQGPNLIRIEKYSNEGELLKAIEFELIQPVMNELFGFSGFNMPSAFFSLDRVGGTVAADYDEVDKQLIFYNSNLGVIFKRDSQDVMRLLTYLPDVPSSKLNPSDSEIRNILSYPMASNSGIQYVVGRKGNQKAFIADSYEPALGAGLVVIRRFDGNKVSNIAGHNVQPVNDVRALRLVKNLKDFTDAKVYEPDLSIVGTNLSTNADTLVLSPEIYAIVELNNKLYFNQGDALYRLDPSQNSISWVLGSHYGGEQVDSQLSSPISTLYGFMHNLEKYDDQSLAIAMARNDQSNQPVYLYRVFVEGSSAGNFETLKIIGGGQNDISGKERFDPSQAALEFEGLSVHNTTPYFLASSSNQSGGFDRHINLYKIDSNGEAVRILDSSKGFARVPAKLNQLKQTPRILFNAGPDILMMNVYFNYSSDQNSEQTQEYRESVTDEGSIIMVESASKEIAGSDYQTLETQDDANTNGFENLDYELQFNLLKPDGKVEFLMGSEGYLETPLMQELLIWPNGDMTLLFAPEHSQDEQADDHSTEHGDKDAYVLFHKPSQQAIPVDDIENSVYFADANQALHGLIPWFSDNLPKVLTLKGQQHLQRLISVDLATHQASEVGPDSEGFQETLQEIESSSGVKPSLEPLIENPRDGSVDLNTLKFAVKHNLGLTKVALPDQSYLDFSIDWNAKKVILMLRARGSLEFYSVDLTTTNLAVSFLFDESQIGLTFEGSDFVIDRSEADITVLGSSLLINNHGSALKLDLKNPDQSDLILVSSDDAVNAITFKAMVDTYRLQDLVAKTDGSVYALAKDLSTGVPDGSYVVAQIINDEPRMMLKFKGIDEELPEFGVTARSLIQGQFPSQLRLSLGDPALISAGKQLYLVGRGQEQSGILAFDDRKSEPFSVTVSQLRLSSGSTQSVTAQDILTFSYDPNEQITDLFFQIGGVPVFYNNGRAEIEINPMVKGFSGKLMAGGIAKDRYGRNSQHFTGFDSTLSYTQDILDFVPKPNDLEVSAAVDELDIFGNQASLTLTASEFTTSFKIEYVGSDDSVINTETYFPDDTDDFVRIDLHLQIPEDAEQIAIYALNPKGQSTPITVTITRRDSVALTGLHGDYLNLAANRIPVKLIRAHSDGVTLLPDFIQYFNGDQSYSFYNIESNHIVSGSRIEDAQNDAAFVAPKLIEDIYQSGLFTFFIKKQAEYGEIDNAIYFGVQDPEDSQIVSASKMLDLTSPHRITALHDTWLIVASKDSNNVNRLHVVDVAELIEAGQDVNAISNVLNDGLDIMDLPLNHNGVSMLGKQINFLHSGGDSVYLGLSDLSNSLREWVFEINEFDTGIESNLIIAYDPSAQAAALNEDQLSFALNDRGFHKMSSFHFHKSKFYMTLQQSANSNGSAVYEWSPNPFDQSTSPDANVGEGGYAKLYLESINFDSGHLETFRKPISGGASATLQMELTDLGFLRLDTSGNLSLLAQDFLYPVMVENEYLNASYQDQLIPRHAAAFRDKLIAAAVDADDLNYGIFMLGDQGRLFYLDRSSGMVYPSTGSNYTAFTNLAQDRNIVGTRDGKIYSVDFENSSVQRTLILTLRNNEGPLSALKLEDDNLLIARGARVFNYEFSSGNYNLLYDLNQHGYSSNKVVALATAGSKNEGFYLYLKDISYSNPAGQVVYSADGINFEFRYNNIYAMSSDEESIYLVGYSDITKINRRYQTVSRIPLTSNQSYWDMFQSSTLKLPAGLIDYYFASGDEQYVIQSIDHVGSQLRVISRNRIFTDILFEEQASKAGDLTNGDSITFRVTLTDLAGDQLEDPPGFDIISRFNGKSLDWTTVSSHTKEVTYIVSARDSSVSSPQLESLMVITDDGTVENYLGVAIDGVNSIQPDQSSLSDWSIESFKYVTATAQQSPAVVVELKQTGAALAQGGILLVQSPTANDRFEFNHGAVTSNQIITQTATLDSNSPIYLASGSEPEGDWLVHWIPFVNSDQRLDDADRNNNSKKVHFNERPRIKGIPAKVVFQELDQNQSFWISVIDEDECSAQLSLESVGDSSIASVRLSLQQCAAQLLVDSVGYGITTFAIRVQDNEGKVGIYNYRIDVQIDKISSTVSSLNIRPGQSVEIPFSVVLDPNANYEFIGKHSDSGVVSSFTSSPGSGSPIYRAKMNLTAGQATGVEQIHIQLHKNNSIVDSYAIKVQITPKSQLGIPPMEYYEGSSETVTANNGHAYLHHTHGSGVEDYYVAEIDQQGFLNSSSTKLQITSNQYSLDITFFNGSFYVLLTDFDSTLSQSFLKIVRLNSDGTSNWNRQFDLQNYSVNNASLSSSYDGQLLVSFEAFDYNDQKTMIGWQKLSGNEVATDSKFSSYPAEIISGTSSISDFAILEQGDEILMSCIKADPNLNRFGYLFTSRWDSSKATQLSSFAKLAEDLIYSMKAISNSTSSYFLNRVVSLNSKAELTNNKLTLWQYSDGALTSDYALDLGIALDLNAKKPEMSLGVQADGRVIIAAQLHHRNKLNQAIISDKTAVYTQLFTQDLKSLFSPLRVSAQIPDQNAEFHDLEYIAKGLWAFAWTANNYVSSIDSYNYDSSGGRAFIRILDTSDKSFFATESFSESQEFVSSIKLQTLSDRLMVITDGQGNVNYQIRELPRN